MTKIIFLIVTKVTVHPISLFDFCRTIHIKNQTMKKNMGIVDRAIRILVTIVIVILYFTNQINGTLAIILEVLAIIFVATSFLSFCPMYLPFGISSRKKP